MAFVPDDDIKWYFHDQAIVKAFCTDPCLTGKLDIEVPHTHPNLNGMKDATICLECGHNAANYPVPVRACALCRQPGRSYKACPFFPSPARKGKPVPLTSTLLRPRGNLGEGKMLSNRGGIVDVFLPQGTDAIDDIRFLNYEVVINARAKPNKFSTQAIQVALLTYAPKSTPFLLVSMPGHRFLLLLHEKANREAFIALVRSNLQSLGLVIYP